MSFRRTRAFAGLLAGFAAAAWLFPRPAAADDFLAGDWTTGNQYRGDDVKGGLDLDSSGDWEADLAYAYAHSNVGTPSRSHQMTLTFLHTLDDNWTSRSGATGWRDTLNNVQYFGPSFGFTYTALEGPAAAADAAEGAGTIAAKESGLYTRDNESSFVRPDETPQDSPRQETLRVSFDSDFFVYQANEPLGSQKVKISRKETETVVAQGQASLAQWHPYFQVEKPLAGGKVVPWILLGHDFYSKDPRIIEDRAGRPQFSASVGSVNGLVGGLLENTGQLGVNFKLPLRLALTASFGSEQLATDNSWATTQSAGVSQLYGDHGKLSFVWNRSIEDGVPEDLITTGASWFF